MKNKHKNTHSNPPKVSSSLSHIAIQPNKKLRNPSRENASVDIWQKFRNQFAQPPMEKFALNEPSTSNNVFQMGPTYGKDNHFQYDTRNRCHKMIETTDCESESESPREECYKSTVKCMNNMQDNSVLNDGQITSRGASGDGSEYTSEKVPDVIKQANRISDDQNSHGDSLNLRNADSGFWNYSPLSNIKTVFILLFRALVFAALINYILNCVDMFRSEEEVEEPLSWWRYLLNTISSTEALERSDIITSFVCRLTNWFPNC